MVHKPTGDFLAGNNKTQWHQEKKYKSLKLIDLSWINDWKIQRWNHVFYTQQRIL